MMIRLRQSSARTYRKCERLYKLTYVDGLTPTRKSSALHIGTFAHAGRAEWLRTMDIAKAVDATLLSVDATLLTHPSLRDITPRTLKNGSGHYADCQCLTCITKTTVDIVTSYCQNWHTRMGKSITQIHAVEQQIEQVLCTYNNLALVLTGTCDADVTYCGEFRMNYEYKTFSKQEWPEFFLTEKMSPQHTTYPFLLEMAKKIPYYGTLLEGTRKPTKEIPCEHYSDVLPKGEDVFEEYKHDMTMLLQRIAFSIENDHWPKNEDSCFSRYGKCAMFNACANNYSRAAMADYDTVEIPLEWWAPEEDE